MILYPSRLEEKIGFSEIRATLLHNCKSELGMSQINAIAFSNKHDIIQEKLQRTAEMTTVIQDEESFPTPTFKTISTELANIHAEGSFLTVQELHILRKSLNETNEILRFFEKQQERLPYLAELAKPILIAKDITVAIDAVIDKHGNMKDNASSRLVEIRGDIAQKRRIVNRIMAQKLAMARSEGWLEQDAEATIRNGRLVLPLNSTFKRKIHGIVHDESATGKTSFIEPAEAFETNNAIANLEFEEQKEITRILKETTANIRPFIPDIEQAYEFLGKIDAIMAKAKLAIDLEACVPHIANRQEVELIQARHPLLSISSKTSGKEVIPLHISLNESQRIIVISGPNAGGKSVCMKTVILIQYMFQCGFPIPADNRTSLGIFNNILIDIGDEQSLENDLSTYSSHLLNMKFFTEHADKKTLLAIDEFGTGTEPILGGAIAESVLERLNDLQCLGVITTHYSNLKHCATSLHGLINGAMLFDMENMRPLYKLRMGSAGNSFAFEIAQSIGLNKKILENAKSKIKQEHIDFDKNLKQLEIEKQYIFRKKEDLRKQEMQLNCIKEEYSNKVKKINEKRQEIIDQTEQEIHAVLDSANRQIEQTVRIIKESKADKETTKQVREEFKQFAEKTKRKTITIRNKSKENNTPKTKKELSVGEYASMRGTTTVGEIINITGKQATVSFGNIKMNVALASLTPASKPKITTKTQIYASPIENIAEKRKHFSSNLDLRGKRGDEAMYLVKDLVETANMLQVKHLEILHGKGYGILRKLIRDYLQTVPFVESCEDAPIEMGGDGISIITLQ